MRVVAEEAFRKDRKFNSQSPQTQYALNPLSSSTPCANPNQPLTSDQRPLLFGVCRDLIRGTSGKCTLIAIRIWQPTPLAARRQRPVHTNPRFAVCAISTAQDYHPNVWSNSSSGIGSAQARRCDCWGRARLAKQTGLHATCRRLSIIHAGHMRANSALAD